MASKSAGMMLAVFASLSSAEPSTEGALDPGKWRACRIPLPAVDGWPTYGDDGFSEQDELDCKAAMKKEDEILTTAKGVHHKQTMSMCCCADIKWGIDKCEQQGCKLDQKTKCPSSLACSFCDPLAATRINAKQLFGNASSQPQNWNTSKDRADNSLLASIVNDVWKMKTNCGTVNEEKAVTNALNPRRERCKNPNEDKLKPDGDGSFFNDMDTTAAPIMLQPAKSNDAAAAAVAAAAATATTAKSVGKQSLLMASNKNSTQ